MDGLKFLSLSSGSSGNCYFLGNTDEGILIDAGISARKINKTLKEHGIDLGIIKGLCISHDHSDHIIAATYWRTLRYSGLCHPRNHRWDEPQFQNA